MAKKHSNRTLYVHRSFRIAEDVIATLERQAKTTGWSAAKVVNAWLRAVRDTLAGHHQAAANLREVIKAAEDLELARLKTEAVLAPLRKKAAAARKALAPLVQRIRQVKRPMKHKAAA